MKYKALQLVSIGTGPAYGPGETIPADAFPATHFSELVKAGMVERVKEEAPTEATTADATTTRKRDRSRSAAKADDPAPAPAPVYDPATEPTPGTTGTRTEDAPQAPPVDDGRPDESGG